MVNKPVLVTERFYPIPLDSVNLLPSVFQQRFDVNHAYVASLWFVPLYDVRDERYTVYFPIRSGR